MEEIINTKKCSKCGRELPLTEFNKNAKSKDGLQCQCRECHSVSMREYIIRRASKEQSDVIEKHLSKVYTNPELAKFKPRELIAELKARGYSGELSYTQKIVV